MEVFSAIFLTLLPLLLVIIFIKQKKNRGQKTLPPGPWKLPFIGNLHQLGLSCSSKLPHVALKELAEKYGPLMHLQLGERPAIVISSYKMLQEAVKTSDLALAGRPEFDVAKTVLYNGGNISFSPYGDFWNQMRKFCTFELLSPKKIQSTYPLMEDEISRLITSINDSATSDTPVNVSECLKSLFCDIICRASVGKACKDPESLISAVSEVVAFVGGLNFSDLFPSLNFSFLQYITGIKQKLDKLHRKCDGLLEDTVREHESTIDLTSNSDQEDFLHLLLKKKESPNSQIPITRDNIKSIILEMFLGGTDSSSSVLEWAMSELVKNPTIMKKAQDEIREALKGKRNVDHKDIKNLKYLKCVIKETMRLHPSGPLSFPRESREECELGGYVIPNKTLVFVNFSAMGKDSQYWRDPEKFEPERFNLADDQQSKGIPPEFLGFGFGKRVCPGMGFGLSAAEFALAKMLYHFDWKVMYPHQELDMTEKLATALTRKNNLYLFASPYDYSHQ